MEARFLNESREYRVARDCLFHKEIGLRRQMEALAIERRALKAGERDYPGQDASLQAFIAARTASFDISGVQSCNSPKATTVKRRAAPARSSRCGIS